MTDEDITDWMQCGRRNTCFRILTQSDRCAFTARRRPWHFVLRFTCCPLLYFSEGALTQEGLFVWVVPCIRHVFHDSEKRNIVFSQKLQ